MNIGILSLETTGPVYQDKSESQALVEQLEGMAV